MLYGFVFLVALGVDYSIFLMTRAREETATSGPTRGVLTALAVTGGVITSAGIVLAATFGALAVLPLLFLAEIAFIVEDCKAAILFVGPEFSELAQGIRAQLPGVRIVPAPEGGPPHWPDSAAPAAAQHRSDPKVAPEAEQNAIPLHTPGPAHQPRSVTGPGENQ